MPSSQSAATTIVTSWASSRGRASSADGPEHHHDPVAVRE